MREGEKKGRVLMCSSPISVYFSCVSTTVVLRFYFVLQGSISAFSTLSLLPFLSFLSNVVMMFLFLSKPFLELCSNGFVKGKSRDTL